MEQLKKCPFCPNGIAEKERIFMIGWTIKCKSCGASSPVKDRLEDAITAWNTRKPMERIVERLDSECKKHCDATRTYIGSDKNDLGLRHLSKANAFCKAIEIVKDEGGV